MEQLVRRIEEATGLDHATAEKAAVIILKFLASEGPPEKVGPLIDSLPGAREALATPIGGSSGLMGIFGDLSSAGLGMSEIQGATRAAVAFAREQAGAETVDAIVAAIPGASQFI